MPNRRSRCEHFLSKQSNPIRKNARLDGLLIEAPALALDLVRRELGELGAATRTMVSAANMPVLTGTVAETEAKQVRSP